MSAHRRGRTRDVCVECWKPWPCPASASPCRHGMPTPASCIDCMDDGNIALPPQRTTRLHPAGPAFTARHQGRCARCDEPIEPGDTIRRWDDDLYRHEDCG